MQSNFKYANQKNLYIYILIYKCNLNNLFNIIISEKKVIEVTYCQLLR